MIAGYIPKLPKECLLSSRHLGLVTAGEIDNIDDIISKQWILYGRALTLT